MNRRNFFKITAAASALTFIPFTFAKPTVESELEDLYRFCESRMVPQWNKPLQQSIPFKLPQFQKDILRDIHIHDKLVIVKSRQIGMTTLLAAYTAWKISKNPNFYVTYAGIEYRKENDRWDRLIGSFLSGQKWKPVGPSQLEILDEYNFRYLPARFINRDIWIRDCLRKSIPNPKYIIAGSVDPDGNLKECVELDGFVTVKYPWMRCVMNIDMNDSTGTYTHYQDKVISCWDNLSRNDPNWQTTFAREFECKFV